MMTVGCGPLQLNGQYMEELMEGGNDALCLAVVTCLVQCLTRLTRDLEEADHKEADRKSVV